MTMGTASTMACMVEALGMGMPGNAAIPAVDARRNLLARMAGRRIVDMVREDLTISKILTREAFENAIRANAAIGGSTNAVIHLIALARRVGVELDLDDWDRLGRGVHTVLNLMPSGKYLMEDFYYAGGLPVVLRELGKQGLLHKKALTVNGKTIWDNNKKAECFNAEVITPFAQPFKKNTGIAVLRGNLCPDGAIIKPSAATPRLMKHKGRAVVFENIEEFHSRIDDPKLDIDENCVMVLKNCGPKGYPGMAEVGNMPLPPKVLQEGHHRHGAHLGRAHERHRLRHGGAAHRARGCGRRRAGPGRERRHDRTRRGRTPTAPGRARTRTRAPAQEMESAQGADDARLYQALCRPRAAGEPGRGPRFPRRRERRQGSERQPLARSRSPARLLLVPARSRMNALRLGAHTMLQAIDPTIRLNPADDVVIARVEVAEGTTLLKEGNVRVAARVPAGHKIAVRELKSGSPVRRYNQIIGFATRDIHAGEHVHVHNIAMGEFDRDYAFCADARPTDHVAQPATFQGIVRADGRVATRNYIGILTSVNCSATVARMIARHFENRLDAFPNVDGVVALTHKSGCGMASEGEPMDVLRRTMAGYARHPNFFAVQVVGLGCEANQINSLLSTQQLKRSDRLAAYTIQEKGGTMKAVREGIARIEAILPEANRVKRETVPASHLLLALQCGGSDGYSGISANPALGAAVDLLVRHGGGAILSETPEIYGAEHLLTRRALTREVGEKLIRRIKWWENYTARNGNEMNNNPSPGNKAGGLTTILEKSLGAVAKGGTTNLVDVYEYAEPVTAKGFVYMDTPGYDPVSATGQIAGGANLVCFTTGRGSAYGCKPAPSLKLATNTRLFEHQEEDMDLNCGGIVDGKESIAEVGQKLFELILKTASGAKTKSEAFGYGEDEFAPWVLGATM